MLFHNPLASDVLNSVVPVNEIPYVDHPELTINKNESTQMPFRYVKSQDGKPIMPEVSACTFDDAASQMLTEQGMIDLIVKDTEKGLDDLL